MISFRVFKYGANPDIDKPQMFCSGGRKRKLLRRGAEELPDGSILLPKFLFPPPPEPKNYIPETLPPAELPGISFEPPALREPLFPHTVFPDFPLTDEFSQSSLALPPQQGTH